MRRDAPSRELGKPLDRGAFSRIYRDISITGASESKWACTFVHPFDDKSH